MTSMIVLSLCIIAIAVSDGSGEGLRKAVNARDAAARQGRSSHATDHKQRNLHVRDIPNLGGDDVSGSSELGNLSVVQQYRSDPGAPNSAASVNDAGPRAEKKFISAVSVRTMTAEGNAYPENITIHVDREPVDENLNSSGSGSVNGSQHDGSNSTGTDDTSTAPAPARTSPDYAPPEEVLSGRGEQGAKVPAGSQQGGHIPVGSQQGGNVPVGSEQGGNVPAIVIPTNIFPSLIGPGGDISDTNFPGANFPDTNFPGINIPGFNFPEINFPGISFPGGNVPGADLPGINYPGVNLPGENLPGINFPAQNFPGDLSAINFPGINFPGGNIPGINFPGINFPELNFPGGNLPEINFPEGNLPGINFPGGNTPGINFPGLNLPEMNFPGENLPGMNFPGGNVPGIFFPGVNLPGLNIPGGNLPEINFPGGNLPGGNLLRINFPEVQFPAGYNLGVNFPGTNLPGFSFKILGTNLSVENSRGQNEKYTDEIHFPGVNYPGINVPDMSRGENYERIHYPGVNYPGINVPAIEITGIVKAGGNISDGRFPRSFYNAKGVGDIRYSNSHTYGAHPPLIPGGSYPGEYNYPGENGFPGSLDNRLPHRNPQTGLPPLPARPAKYRDQVYNDVYLHRVVPDPHLGHGVRDTKYSKSPAYPPIPNVNGFTGSLDNRLSPPFPQYPTIPGGSLPGQFNYPGENGYPGSLDNRLPPRNPQTGLPPLPALMSRAPAITQAYDDVLLQDMFEAPSLENNPHSTILHSLRMDGCFKKQVLDSYVKAVNKVYDILAGKYFQDSSNDVVPGKESTLALLKKLSASNNANTYPVYKHTTGGVSCRVEEPMRLKCDTFVCAKLPMNVVCDTDGNAYYNRCHLDFTAFCSNHVVKPARDGACPQDDTVSKFLDSALEFNHL